MDKVTRGTLILHNVMTTTMDNVIIQKCDRSSMYQATLLWRVGRYASVTRTPGLVRGPRLVIIARNHL